MSQPKHPAQRRSPFIPCEVKFQPCERRLVLSAQMLFDVLGDHALQMHVLEQPSLADSSPLPIQNHASPAHQLTGWEQVQQQFGLTGKGQTVAVIDSGIAWDHVALGKGFGAGYRVVGGWDFSEENDARPYDDGPTGFHGTHVAGIIGSDDPTRTGVAPDVDLVALRVFNDAGQGQIGWVEKALQWVHNNRSSFENPITTVNLSLGTTWNANTVPDWGTLEEELRTLYNDGIVVTASAGNSFKQYNAPGLSYPAVSPYVLPVASVDDNGQLSDFSQRNEHVIAAPGRNISSTVPDHLLGRDGKVNDFSTATGTSMAAPYVAGASVLVRQAMEMAGWSNISMDTIAGHLHSTADKIFDSITKASYDRLDLQQAIDAIIPDDNIGDVSQNAKPLTSGLGGFDTSHSSNGKIEGWINSLNDVDVYQFTAGTSGRLQIDANSHWIDSLQWSIFSEGREIETGSMTPETIALTAGRRYEIRVDADREIGTFELGFDFHSNRGSSSGSNSATGRSLTDLGQVDYLQRQVGSGSAYRVQALNDGLMTVLWENADAAQGSLEVLRGSSSQVDSSWANGQLRLDLQAKAGEWFEIRTPGVAADQGDLTVANVLSQSGRELHVLGSANGDTLAVNLQNGVSINFGQVNYTFTLDQVNSVDINGAGAADQVHIVGSTQSESIELRSGESTLSSSRLKLVLRDIEQVQFVGGGGSDSAYLFDTDGNDTLTARPKQVEMEGAGYNFQVRDATRIFVHATAGGTDIGYFYDSAGDDKLSIRPQFSSMNGDGYFNYISGIERVYAYGTAGGFDVVDIYDSAGNDRFVANGDTASTFGSGFTSYTKAFERVNAIASAGGIDTAQLYAANAHGEWLRGSDFVSVQETGLFREARGFETVERYVAGGLMPSTLSSQSVAIEVRGLMVVGNADTLSDGQAAVNPIPAVTGPWQTTSCPAGGMPMQPVPGVEVVHGVTTQDSPWTTLIDDSADLQILEEVRELGSWVTQRFELPDETLMIDPAEERRLLDELFSRFAEQE